MRLPLLLLITLYFNSQIVQAQNIPVGSIDMLEQRSRNEQLLGKGDSLISYTLRPIDQKLINTVDDENSANTLTKIKVKALPISLIQQYNTFAPYGWNDGAMIPAKGYQTLSSGGIYAKYKFLSIQLNPEYVFALNPDYPIFPLTETDAIRGINTYYLNYTDLPAPYGSGSYSKLNWGQSNISIAINKMSIGLSTENMWWGPGIYNSLIMSNNANGFLHFTINTREPIKTAIGSFEGQIICGKLKNSGIRSPKSQFIIDGEDYEIEKSTDWRYINGLSINYQPKWVPGLFFRAKQSNSSLRK